MFALALLNGCICTCLLQIVRLFLGCKWVTCHIYFNIVFVLYLFNHQYCVTVVMVMLFPNGDALSCIIFGHMCPIIFCRYNGAPNCYGCQMFAADVL